MRSVLCCAVLWALGRWGRRGVGGRRGAAGRGAATGPGGGGAWRPGGGAAVAARRRGALQGRPAAVFLALGRPRFVRTRAPQSPESSPLPPRARGPPRARPRLQRWAVTRTVQCRGLERRQAAARPQGALPRPAPPTAWSAVPAPAAPRGAPNASSRPAHPDCRRSVAGGEIARGRARPARAPRARAAGAGGRAALARPRPPRCGTTATTKIGSPRRWASARRRGAWRAPPMGGPRVSAPGARRTPRPRAVPGPALRRAPGAPARPAPAATAHPLTPRPACAFPPQPLARAAATTRVSACSPKSS
jgi:hypothetical protein